ncbi:hypothetical protein SERLA73DRAFT_157282 [Serpula lacrymans var. lacrymans S7.3]|uniref:Uncharacterized protein n=1 Tax=Serpula lacrymans var. lacrymans (strain S7.3) TaxID=936435 RepID=F8QIA8_SERL3|nr:hypothetical protein SERLA73DRAFT_157282 [Serpula lacrymans var. lacrymans S7.3]
MSRRIAQEAEEKAENCRGFNFNPEKPVTGDTTKHAPSPTFIQIIYHPQSGSKEPVTILLNTSISSAHQHSPQTEHESTLAIKPWVLFHTRSDFEYAETAIKGLLGKEINYPDMEQTLQVARTHYVQFQEGSVSANYLGEMFNFNFKYRDPWKIYCNWITDKTLAPLIYWYPYHKYHCQQNGRIVLKEHIYNEFNLASIWWHIQVSFPQDENPPHCFLPISLWLDKRNIAKQVKKHPIIICPLFLPHKVRNASGNGEGVLVGYMPIPQDPANPSDRNAPETV